MAISAIVTAPAQPAPPIPTYPQFFGTTIPEGSEAVRAYRGYIRPFSDDATARRVLRAITAEQSLDVAAGRLDSEAQGLPLHPLEAYLDDMTEPCTVVVLEFSGRRHPRAFLVEPLPIRGISGSQHIWWDKTELIDGTKTPELCIYSGNLFKYDPSVEHLPQFLNQLSTYLAKHLIFLRTRMLHTRQKDGTLRRASYRKPWQQINLGLLKLSKKLVWFGAWIGAAAPHHPAKHLQTIDPDEECWCNSGETYRTCHMASDQNLIAKS